MIPQKMKALIAYAPEDYRLEEVPVPVIGEHDILVKIEACGICASDVKSYRGAPKIWGGQGNAPYIRTPVIAGHEFVGHVAAMGSMAANGKFRIGDRIVSEQIVPCRSCRYCDRGQYWMCQKHDIYGFRPEVNGGMAEYMVFPAHALNYAVPAHIPLEQAVLIEPYACAEHCVNRANISVHDVVVLSGAGTLGLGMVGAIKLRSPRTLIVLDLIDHRLDLAKQFGADYVVNPAKEDALALVHALTDGYGCDVYIEATGHPASVQQGLDMVCKLGTFVEFSVFKDPVTVDWSIIGDTKELTIYGAHLSPYCYDSVIARIANGQLPTDGVVTHRLPLERWEEGFALAERGTESLKVVLIP